jgi:hypothetical protein
MRIVHLPDGFDTTTRDGRHTFIHELGHVWQGENEGPYYMGHALFSQLTLGSAAYSYGGEAALTANTVNGGTLESFNEEQQAQIIADYYNDVIVDAKTTTTYDPYIAEVRAAA